MYISALLMISLSLYYTMYCVDIPVTSNFRTDGVATSGASSQTRRSRIHYLIFRSMPSKLNPSQARAQFCGLFASFHIQPYPTPSSEHTDPISAHK